MRRLSPAGPAVCVKTVQVRGGFPPRRLEFPSDAAASIASLGIQSGDSLTVNRLAGRASAASASAAAGAGAAAAAASSNGQLALSGLSEDEQLARAIALSLGDAVSDAPAAAPTPAVAAAPLQRRQEASPVRSHPPSGGRSAAFQGAPTAVALPDGTAVVRRIIDSDNSCLFNAVGYVTQHSRSLAPQLRWAGWGAWHCCAACQLTRTCMPYGAAKPSAAATHGSGPCLAAALVQHRCTPHIRAANSWRLGYPTRPTLLPALGIASCTSVQAGDRGCRAGRSL